ncbi:hypothetical protein, partial [Roseobacter sp. HKCCA2468]|uniref:hypothetical protein n=1 Tax=Roseobacter sp. HKCCA2468 TaxID=3120342 RepID=UPI0030ED0CE4
DAFKRAIFQMLPTKICNVSEYEASCSRAFPKSNPAPLNREAKMLGLLLQPVPQHLAHISQPQ